MKGDLYLAWSSDKEIRERGETGGAVTSLLKFALESATVDAVLAINRRNGNRYDGILSLIADPSQIMECAGTLHCVSVNIARNLKEYLDGARGMKMAVTCKPCDARAIIELAKRGQINIKNLILIGLNCTGTLLPEVARRMIKEEYGVNPSEVVKEDIEDGNFVITLSDGTKKERELQVLEEKGYGRRENCRRCATNIPRMADIACGKWGIRDKKATFIEICSEKGSKLIESAIEAGVLIAEPPDEEAIKERDKKDKDAIELAKAWGKRDLEALRLLPYDDRLRYWLSHFERCIKCFGCRDACPICYCTECYLEPGRGFVKGGELPPDRMFPLVRLAHVADSCVNCGQCQDACPMEIPLTKLYYMLHKELSSMFDYIPGMDVGDYPPLTIVTDEELAIDDVNVFVAR